MRGPTIRERVVQGALKQILEPIFEADFQSASYGYRPRRTTIPAANRVSDGIVYGKTLVLDLDLSSFFDNVRHDLVLAQVAKAVTQASCPADAQRGFRGSAAQPCGTASHLSERQEKPASSNAIWELGRGVTR
ncbi:MAG: hypothetical protein JJE39_09945 [Vicinamibacteria bacterium]|nr:hypothetical protein [Vicinamibacteria bacterium]